MQGIGGESSCPSKPYRDVSKSDCCSSDPIQPCRRRRHRAAGAALTLLAMGLLWGLFWGFGSYAHWRTNFYTASSADFVKDLYTTTWHVEHDTSATQVLAMNYPHGEYYTFTGLQPLVAWPLQVAHRAGVVEASRAVLPAYNLLTWLSVMLCALFLYLLFVELRLPVWYAALAALLVTLLSPQLQRMGGHLSLSYYCAIPMLLYFTVRHLRTCRWGYSAAIGLLAILFGLSHPYYLVFYLSLSACVWLYLLLRRGVLQVAPRQLLLSALLQVVLPVVLFYAATHVGLAEGCRTSVPNGFGRYGGRVEGLLFPYGRLYFWEHSHLWRDVEWEARAYVGLVGVGCTLYVVYHFVRSLLTRRPQEALRPTDSRELNLLLLVAVLLTVYACGVPMKWLPRNALTFIGPLAQIRAGGRLTWLFYYTINVVAFVLLHRWWSTAGQGKRGRTAVLAVALLLAGTEAVDHNLRNKAWYNNSWPEWTDYDNRTADNAWVHTFDPAPYQAVLSLPIFNVGSEFIYLPDVDDMFRRSAYISIKTGLPLICHESARSDVQQAWACLSLAHTAWDKLPLATSLPDNRPLLVAVSPDRGLLNEAERRLLSLASPVGEANGVPLFALPVAALDSVVVQTQRDLRALYASTPLTAAPADTVRGNLHSRILLLDQSTTFVGNAELSFWMSDVMEDLHSRTTVWVDVFDAEGQRRQIHSGQMEDMIDIINSRSGEGLVRCNFCLPEDAVRLRVTVRNAYVRRTEVQFRSILLRPEDCPVAFSAERDYINNIPLPDEEPSSLVQ